MSWTQGISLREELPKKLVDLLESFYYKTYGSNETLDYITWFDFDDYFIADFGPNANYLKCRIGQKNDQNV